MMSEVLNRRLKIKKNNDNIVPDIIIIDGGRGQYNAVKKILDLKKFNNISLISVSKGQDRNAGREIIHLDNKNINLPPNEPLLFFIQRIRDEAHRFAITAHRARRNKKSFESIFIDLPGIGPRRKKLLIGHFGSIEKIKNASKKDLLSINGIPEKIINGLYDFFHSQ
jgi:excinuclease ABC subunit C